MVVPIRCRCQQEVQDKEEAERKHREFLDQVSRLKANGLQDKSLREYTFANDKGYNPEMQKAHDYVVHWSEMKAKSIGLLLWGDVGTGKSFFAGCIANALLEQGVPVLMTNFSRILNALSGLYSEEKNQYIDSLNQYSLLIIDDLGIERSTESVSYTHLDVYKRQVLDSSVEPLYWEHHSDSLHTDIRKTAFYQRSQG